MKIIIADNAGFCFGVKRAVDIATDQLETLDKDIYSLGPLIHNPQVVNEFESKGLKTIEDIKGINDGKIIIRAHGVPKAIINDIQDKNLDLVDTTCPYVLSVHKKVEEFQEQGYNIIIIGDSNHPEVIGINGWCNNKAIIINSEEEAKEISNLDKVCIVSQTTNTKEKFELLSEIINEQNSNVKIYNTICNATSVRQKSCKEVASNVEAMIVVGGYHSANTKKLVEISKVHCDNVYHIEMTKELPLQEFLKFNTIGITAGASTPDWIIKEVVETMNNLDKGGNEMENENEIIESEVIETEVIDEIKNEAKDKPANESMSDMDNEMMEAMENTFTRISRGQVLKGEVLFVTDMEVMVNINFKSDGIISRDELSNDPEKAPRDLYKVGDEINVYVIKIDDGDGNVVLSSKRVEDSKSWDELQEIFDNNKEIECTVLNNVKGGLAVLVNGVNGFMPASHVSVRFVSDLAVYKGRKLTVKVIDFDNEKKRIIVSRKEIEKVELDSKRKDLWANLEVGNMITGVVQRLTDFGAFVDLGGLDGLIHISDLSWNRVKHPSEVVKADQTVEVKILALDEEKNRISLGLKQTTEEPWIAFSKNVNLEDTVNGTVVNLMDFGAFVRLDEGVDGLLHVSQISNEHINKPSDVLKVGEKIKVRVIAINEEDKKISLSTKEDVELAEEVEEYVKEEESEITIGEIIDKE